MVAESDKVLVGEINKWVATPLGLGQISALQIKTRSAYIRLKHAKYTVFQHLGATLLVLENDGKTQKKIISPSKHCMKHPRTGQNTQQIEIVKKAQLKLICSTVVPNNPL